MNEFELKHKQSELFLRYRKIIDKISSFNEYNDPINATKLAQELKKHKQQISKILKTLEDHQMIYRFENPEFQKRGGKSRFITLTKVTINLIKNSGFSLDYTIKTKIDTSKINEYIETFNTAKNIFVQDQSLQSLFREIILLIRENDEIQWDSENNLKNFINILITQLKKYDEIIQHRLFEILDRLYISKYYDEKNFIILSKYLKKQKFSEKNKPLINYIISILIIAIKNYPVIDSIHYKLFIEILPKLKNFEKDFVYSIGNKSDVIREFPIEIKDDLQNELFEILNSIKNFTKNGKRSIIERILELLRE